MEVQDCGVDALSTRHRMVAQAASLCQSWGLQGQSGLNNNEKLNCLHPFKPPSQAALLRGAVMLRAGQICDERLIEDGLWIWMWSCCVNGSSCSIGIGCVSLPVLQGWCLSRPPQHRQRYHSVEGAFFQVGEEWRLYTAYRFLVGVVAGLGLRGFGRLCFDIAVFE